MVFIARVIFEHYSPVCTTSLRVIDLRHFFMAYTRPTMSTISRQIMNTQAANATMTGTETFWESAVSVGVGELGLTGVLQWGFKLANCCSVHVTLRMHRLSMPLVNREQTTSESFAGEELPHQYMPFWVVSTFSMVKLSLLPVEWVTFLRSSSSLAVVEHGRHHQATASIVSVQRMLQRSVTLLGLQPETVIVRLPMQSPANEVQVCSWTNVY